jgi:hypothetical protein
MGRKGGKRCLETMTKAARVDRAKKAAAQSIVVMTPAERTQRARKAAQARWNPKAPQKKAAAASAKVRGKKV